MADQLTSLDTLDFDIRTVNLLRRHGITSVEQLSQITIAEAREWYGAGERTLQKLRPFLAPQPSEPPASPPPPVDSIAWAQARRQLAREHAMAYRNYLRWKEAREADSL